MKKTLLSLILALSLVIAALTPAHAAGLLDSLGGLVKGVLGGEDHSSAPSTEFTGETVEVEVNGRKLQIHLSLKAALEEYEAFFDEYIRLITSKQPDPLQLMTFTARYTTTMEALDAIDEVNLSDADNLYYVYMLNRINEKLMAAALD